jgi:hypothetical protein
MVQHARRGIKCQTPHGTAIALEGVTGRTLTTIGASSHGATSMRNAQMLWHHQHLRVLLLLSTATFHVAAKLIAIPILLGMKIISGQQIVRTTLMVVRPTECTRAAIVHASFMAKNCLHKFTTTIQ